MAPSARARFSRLLLFSFRTDPAQSTHTELLQPINEQTRMRALDLAMRLGETMLGVGASAHDVTVAVVRVAQVYGLQRVQVSVTLTSIVVSYHRGDDDWPTTLLRVVKAPAANHSKLQMLQQLEYQIESGLGLEEARARLRTIRHAPFPYRPFVTILAQALLATGVSIMFGAKPVIIALTFLAALTAALTQAGLAKTGVPVFFKQIAGGFAVTVFAIGVSTLGALGFEPFMDVQPSIIVVSGIMLMLAGMTVVGATQDAIDGFTVTASARILELMILTLGVVLGILFALELGSLLGMGIEVHTDPVAFGSLTDQLAGALIVSAAVALTNGATLRTTVVSGLLSILAMLGYAGGVAFGLQPAAASGVGALAASFVGGFVSYRLQLPAAAVTTAAIIPLVPGAAVFRGLLAIAQSEGPVSGLVLGGTALVGAAMTGIALATGASLGLLIARPVRARLRTIVRQRVPRGRPRAAGAGDSGPPITRPTAT